MTLWHRKSEPEPEPVGTRLGPSAATRKIADGAVETGNILEDLRNGDPKMVEALILTALARTTLNGMTDMGKEQARHFLDVYRQHVIDEAQGSNGT